MLTGAGEVMAGGVGGAGGMNVVVDALVSGTVVAGTPSVSIDNPPETLLRRMVVPPLPTWVTFTPCPMANELTGSEERILPLTLLISTLQ